MAGMPITIDGVICDLYGRTITGPVKIVGSVVRTDVGVGGGPIFPPDGGDGKPPFDPGAHPEHPIFYPPGTRPHPEHPIVLPPEQVPPEQRPPEVPPPGTVTPVPPPAGSAGWPVSSMVPPPYVVMNYPGYGPVVVTPPPHAEPAH